MYGASNRDRTGDLILTMDALYLLSYGSKYGSPNRTRTCDNSINSRVLYQLSYQGIMLGDVLLSQDPAVQVPSTLEGLTVVFGMGTRGSLPPSSPNVFLSQGLRPENWIETKPLIIFMCFLDKPSTD